MNKNNKLLLTVAIIVGVGTIFIMMMSPSPFLIAIGEHFEIDNDFELNMVVNIFFFFAVLACIVGAKIQISIGLRKLYDLALLCCIAGSIVLVFGEVSYLLVLVGRALIGAGYGFSIPFIGAAIMRWYDPLQREKMDTLNGLFPFIGTLISFLLAIPLASLFGDSWALSLAFWGIPVVITLVIWAKCIDFDSLQSFEEEQETETGLFKGLLKRREMRLLLLASACDYGSYAYVGTVLPMLLIEAGDFSESTANTIAALAFPGVGVVGIIIAGYVLTKIGVRKPLLLMGQYGEIIGLLIAAIGVNFSIALFILGIVIFAFSNAIWTPALFVVPMDLEDMNSARSGAAFALIGIVGESFCFLAPSVGGLLTGLFLSMFGGLGASAHVVALSLSIAVFGLSNILGAVSMTIMPETGKRGLTQKK